MMNLQNKIITHMTLFVDASSCNTPSYVYAKQLDVNSRYLAIRIMGANGPVDIQGTARLNATRPDGTPVNIPATHVEEDGTIIIGLTPTLLALDGKIPCDVTVLGAGGDGAQLTTSTFFLLVDKSHYDSGAVEEEEKIPTQVNGLTTAVDKADNVTKMFLSVNGAPFGEGAPLPKTDVSYLSIEDGKICVVFEEEDI